MAESWALVRALAVGVLIGGVFYGGLWWTVRRSLSIRHPGAWILGSFMLRTSVALGGFYLAARDDWRALLTCFLGFLIARIGVTRLTRASLNYPSDLLQGRPQP